MSYTRRWFADYWPLLLVAAFLAAIACGVTYALWFNANAPCAEFDNFSLRDVPARCAEYWGAKP